MSDTMAEFLDVAIDAAKKGGEVLMKHYQKKITVEMKADKTFVTNVDKESEEVIMTTIKKSFPDHAFFGEEFGKTGQSEYVWLIDPLDGTHHFMRDIPHFAVLIALMKENTIIMGLSYDPNTGHLMYAERGKGVTIEGETAKLSTVAEVNKAMCSFQWLVGFARAGLAKELMDLLGHITASTLLDAREQHQSLLTGKIDAMITAEIGIYDVAPYVLMIEELGGIATDIRGKPMGLDSTSFIGANKELHGKLVEFFT